MQKLEGEKRAESLLYVRVHTHTHSHSSIHIWMDAYVHVCTHGTITHDAVTGITTMESIMVTS